MSSRVGGSNSNSSSSNSSNSNSSNGTTPRSDPDQSGTTPGANGAAGGTDPDKGLGSGSADDAGAATDQAVNSIDNSAIYSGLITAAQTAANAKIMAANAASQVFNGMMSAALESVSGVVKLMKDATHATKEAAEKPN